MTVRSRIAPTPSGFLHLGNALNFLLTWLHVRDQRGTLKLRIDDCDRQRSRPAFIEDIFRQLDWLGITWDEGPTGPDDFARRHSQGLQTERYREALAEIAVSGRIYACTCSRKKILATGSQVYSGACRHQRSKPQQPHALRIHIDEGTRITVGGREIPLAAAMGDFILWRRDDLPAYQLVSLVDDIDDRIDLVVRGEDLLESTAAQMYLADCWRNPRFAQVRFLHHPLITCANGRKLSKSDGALSLAAMRQQGATPTDIYREAARWAGRAAMEIVTLADLLAVFKSASTCPGRPEGSLHPHPFARIK